MKEIAEKCKYSTLDHKRRPTKNAMSNIDFHMTHTLQNLLDLHDVFRYLKLSGLK